MEVEEPADNDRPAAEEEAAANDDAASLAESSTASSTIAEPGREITKFKLSSPMGGRALEFTYTKGQANREFHEELHMHLTNTFKLGMGIKEAFEKPTGKSWTDINWMDIDECKLQIARINKVIASVVSLWRGATRPKTDSEWFQSPYCTAEQAKRLSFVIFNRVVKNASVLNKCYKSFTSQTYGETSFDQIEIILDKLQMTEKDVFLDLGSGVGHVVTYASAYSMAKKCVGIEINATPAGMAAQMQREFEAMMSWYGKKFRPISLIQGDFMQDKFRKLILEEATVIFINNYAFEPSLMYQLRQLILEMPTGTRIICTKSFSEEREERPRGGALAAAAAGCDSGDDNSNGSAPAPRKARPTSKRTLQRQTVDMMLDCEELPLADMPVSWSDGRNVKFFLFTVNHSKINLMWESANNSTPSSTRSGSAEAAAVAGPSNEDESREDRSISATIDMVASARGVPAAVPVAMIGGVARREPLRMYRDEDDSDDDEDYLAPGAQVRRYSGLDKKRRGKDEEYVPKKRSSAGSSSKHAKKDANPKKDKPSSAKRSGALAVAGNMASQQPAAHPHAKDQKVKKEEARASSSSTSKGGVWLDGANPVDRMISKSSAAAASTSSSSSSSSATPRDRGRTTRRSVGEPLPKRHRSAAAADKENRSPKPGTPQRRSRTHAPKTPRRSTAAPPAPAPLSFEQLAQLKPASALHCADQVPADAPDWVGKCGKMGSGSFVGVFAHHHSIFETDPHDIPKKRERKPVNYT